MDEFPGNLAPLILQKGEERRLLAGHLWVYSNEVDTAHSPLKAYEPGQPVEVISQRGQWLAHAYVNPHSLIAARVTSRQRARPLDNAELVRRLQAAADLRARLYRAPCYRWVYGESDALPGLVVDRYGAVAVVQINTAGMERRRGEIVEALRSVGGLGGDLSGVLLRCDGESRALENLPSYVETAYGSVPAEAEIEENGIPFVVPLAAGQKTGWFYDQADNRLRGRPLLNSGTVIDAFCYAGGWGVNAALAGAARVICVDSSESALAYARRNAERNGVVGRMAFLRGDVADVLRGFAGKEKPGTIVLDPPAFVKRKKDLEAGAVAYQRLNELALALLPDGGFLVSCSCSQHVDRDTFLRLLQKASRRAGSDLRLLFEGGQSVDHPVHPAMPETRYLKALFLQVAGTDALPG
jgi:23S rRNA (cytosine1962-C5)-methyltransferase